jgi:REP element-mobilizing transposase RayT
MFGMALGYPAAVSKPRQVLPKTTYLITRRTILRHMLLRPDGLMTQIILYLLAVIAKRACVEVHAVCAMSTHIHLVATDMEGKLPEFLHAFHRMVALCTKAHRQWDHPVWDDAPTSVVRLENDGAIVEKITYVLANPVAAGLVRHAHEWPGATVLVDHLGGGELTARRPEVYLHPRNWPAEATLSIAPPPGVTPEEMSSFRDRVRTEVARLEAQAHGEMDEQARAFLGAAAARTVPTTARATAVEPKIDRNPTFAVGRNQGDAWQRAVAALQSFRTAYRAALEKWRAGVRDVVFPAGTWLMRTIHRATVAPHAASG